MRSGQSRGAFPTFGSTREPPRESPGSGASRHRPLFEPGPRDPEAARGRSMEFYFLWKRGYSPFHFWPPDRQPPTPNSKMIF